MQIKDTPVGAFFDSRTTVYEQPAKEFKALGDEKRLRILELLRGGEKCACVLLEQMDMPQ